MRAETDKLWGKSQGLHRFCRDKSFLEKWRKLQMGNNELFPMPRAPAPQPFTFDSTSYLRPLSYLANSSCSGEQHRMLDRQQLFHKIAIAHCVCCRDEHLKEWDLLAVLEGGYDAFPGVQAFGVKVYMNAPQISRTGKLKWKSSISGQHWPTETYIHIRAKRTHRADLIFAFKSFSRYHRLILSFLI